MLIRSIGAHCKIPLEIAHNSIVCIGQLLHWAPEQLKGLTMWKLLSSPIGPVYPLA